LWQEYTSLPQHKGTFLRITPFTMYIAGILHDIGKKHIPLEIIDKPGRLDADEASVMVRHTEIGYETVKPFDPTIAQIIRGHHAYGKNASYMTTTGAHRGSEINAAQLVMAIADKPTLPTTAVPTARRAHGEVAQMLRTPFGQELERGSSAKSC
jgi:hypothetical protein